MALARKLEIGARL